MSTQFTNRQWRLPNEENKSKVSNYSMDFDGTQYINVGVLSALNNVSQFSISFWAEFASGTTEQTIFTNRNQTTSWTDRIEIYRYGTNVYFHVNNSSQGGSKNAFLAAPSNGVWTHIAMVFDGGQAVNDDRIKIYYQGVKQSPTISSNFNTSTSTGATSLIGARTGSANKEYSGKLDAVSIFNYALSSSQITTLYGSSSTGIGNPMAISGGGKPVAFYQLGDKSAFNSSSYLIPNSSLKDYVFDGYPGGTKLINSNINQSNTGGKFTISFWHKYNGSGLVGFNHGGGKIGQFRYYAQPIVYLSSSYYQYFNISTSTLLANTNWQHFVVFIDTSNVTNSKLWIDGSSISSAGYGTGGSANSFTSGLQLDLGAFPEISNMMYFTNYEINQTNVDVLYNNGVPITSTSGLSTAPNHWWKLDASDTYDSSTGNWTIEDHVGSNDGTSSGMTQANLVQSDLSFTSGYSPYALDFDSASTDYISCGNDSSLNTNALTVSCWVKAPAFTPAIGPAIISKDGQGGTNRSFGFLYVYGSFLFQNWDSAGNENRVTIAQASNPINTDGQWHHLLATIDGTTNANGIKVYIDNVVIGQATATATGIRTSTVPFVIGGSGSTGSTYTWNGQISNVSYWNAALTPAQVTEIYNEGVPSNLNNHSAYSNLVSWWQLGSNSSFNTNWTVLDEKGSNNGTSVNMTEADIVDGVGSSANGLSSGMGGDEVIGDAPYSSSNSLSVNMDVLDRVTDTPS